MIDMAYNPSLWGVEAGIEFMVTLGSITDPRVAGAT